MGLSNSIILLVLLLSVTLIKGANTAHSIGTIKPMDGQIVRFDGYRSPALRVTDTSIGPY